MKLKRILVCLDSSAESLARIETAFNIAGAGGAVVTAILPIHIEIPAIPTSTMHGGWYMGEKIISKSREQAMQSAKMIEEACMLLAEEYQQELKWQQKEGDVALIVSEEGRYHDLLILGKPDPAHTSPSYRNSLNSILVESGTECLVMPDAAPGFRNTANRVLVAWDGSRESAAAVRGAMHFLDQANEIYILTAYKGEDDKQAMEQMNQKIRDLMSVHGIEAGPVLIQQEGLSSGRSILKQAGDINAELIVMGAYGHSRFREIILGGATRYILQHADVPVLFAH
ncbi:MAG: universal stress protein [Arenicellales bacterium]